MRVLDWQRYPIEEDRDEAHAKGYEARKSDPNPYVHMTALWKEFENSQSSKQNTKNKRRG